MRKCSKYLPPQQFRSESNILDSEAQVIARGCQAINTLYGMTSRIPQLMQQSHLESSEGTFTHVYKHYSAV
jgi:hypothetical protein